jgi:hypothetical protein
MFCSWELPLSNGVIVHSLSVVVSLEINGKHYFWSKLIFGLGERSDRRFEKAAR